MSILNRNVYQTDLDVADSLSGTPPQSGWAKWLGGAIVPLLIGWYGLGCCLSQEARFVGTQGAFLDLTGRAAVALGLAWLSGAAFLHFHFFWGNLKKLSIFSNLGKVLSALCLLASFGYTVWKIIERI